MDRDAMLKKIRASEFPRNNGHVLRCINLLDRRDYSPLERVMTGVKNWGVEKAEFLDSVHFLKLNGYIETRTINGKTPDADLADYEFTEIEARVSAKGIRLMQGSISDECVIV